MAEVAILHAPDKAAAAARLAEAIAAAGYAVAGVEVEAPERLAEALGSAAADARILIWSRPLVAHALLIGEVARIRQLRDVIEVSADGIEPPSSGGEGRVVLISGWRGQPFHPGWQRIQLELKRLCGARKGAVEAPRPASARAARRAAPAASPTAADRPRARTGLIAGGAAAALLVAAVIGGASWFGRSAPAERPRQEVPEAAPTPPPLPQPEASPVPAAAPASAPAPVPVTSAPAPSSPPAAPAAAGEAAATAPSAAPPAKPRPARPATRAPRPDSRVATKKYSPRNSRVMRQFCARSGRSTPQCRTFLNAVAD